jgi:hypothetical protein
VNRRAFLATSAEAALAEATTDRAETSAQGAVPPRKAVVWSLLPGGSSVEEGVHLSARVDRTLAGK